MVPWDHGLGRELCWPGCVPGTGLGHCQAHWIPGLAPSGAPHTPWSGTRANPQQHRVPSLSCGPSRDNTGGSAGQTGPFHSPETQGSFITGGLPRCAVGSRHPCWHGAGVAGGGARTSHRAGAFAGCCEQHDFGLPGCTAEREDASLSIPPACLCAGQGDEGALLLGSQGVHRVPASLTEPWGRDSMEGFVSALLWGKSGTGGEESGGR